MITKSYLMNNFITLFEEKFGALATTIPEQRTNYIRYYYGILKYNPNVDDYIKMMLESETITPPNELAWMVSDEGKM